MGSLSGSRDLKPTRSQPGAHPTPNPWDEGGIFLYGASVRLRAYLWPENPTFFGFLVMVSICNFLKKGGFGGPKVEIRVRGVGILVWLRV